MYNITTRIQFTSPSRMPSSSLFLLPEALARARGLYRSVGLALASPFGLGRDWSGGLSPSGGLKFVGWLRYDGGLWVGGGLTFGDGRIIPSHIAGLAGSEKKSLSNDLRSESKSNAPVSCSFAC